MHGSSMVLVNILKVLAPSQGAAKICPNIVVTALDPLEILIHAFTPVGLSTAMAF